MKKNKNGITPKYNYTIDDIDIFIITHKRSHYIGESLQSLINQTAGIKEITILDNEATGETEEILKQFDKCGVKLNYITTEGFLGNFIKAQELAKRKYCMLFHDDDLLHPVYLEYVLKALNKYENITFLTTRLTEFWNDNVPKYAKKVKEAHFLFKTQAEFTRRMFFAENIAYATVVYRTEDFKKETYDLESFGKIADWPLMIILAKYGNTILFDDKKLLLTRRHNEQEIWKKTYHPSPQQLATRDRLFYNAMKINIFNPHVFIAYTKKSIKNITLLYNNFISEKNKDNYSILDQIKLSGGDGHLPLLFYYILNKILFNKITEGIIKVELEDRKIKLSLKFLFIEIHLMSYKYKKYIKKLS